MARNDHLEVDIRQRKHVINMQARIQDFLQGGVNDGRVLRAPLASAPTGGLGLINIRLRYIASIEYSERFFLIFFFWLVKKFVEKQNWWSRAGGGHDPQNPPPGSAPDMSDRTKFRTYANTNSETSVHPMYTNVSVTINEHDRIAASRLRLSSHSLAIETGRWSCVPRERWLCSCGEVQTEQHVVCHCPRTIHVRERHPNLNFTDIGSFFDNTDISSVCRVSSLVLKEFMR